MGHRDARSEKKDEFDAKTKDFAEWQDGHRDLTIMVHGASTRAHRAVLMKHSGYFQNLFSESFSEREAEVVYLSYYFNDIKELDIVLKYVYTGNIVLTGDNIRSVLNTAALFLLGDLKTTCAEFLMTNIAPCTALNIFVLADTYTLTDVRSACLEVIKAWFPFNLCESKEALEMSPDCLKLLVQENIFALLPCDIKESFLARWHENFEARFKECAVFPKEVEDLLLPLKSQGSKLRKWSQQKSESAKQNTAKSRRQEAAQVGVSQRSEPQADEVEEVLLCYAVPSNRVHQFVEVMAFSPSTKSWKSVLRHAFVKFPTNDKNVKLIGLTEHKAYFAFRDPHFLNHYDDCVLSVDLQTKEESVIKPPQSADRPREYFLLIWKEPLTSWPDVKLPPQTNKQKNDTLCAFAFDVDSSPRVIVLAFYTNEHETKCPKTCEGSCWYRACSITLKERGELRPTTSFRSIVFKGKIYVWVQTLKTDCPAQMEYYCISQEENEDKWEVKQLRGLWSLSHVNKKSFDFSNSIMCPISVDPKTSALKFTLKLRFGRHEDDSPRGGCHKEYIYTFDPARDEWKEIGFRKVVYPEPTGFVGDTSDFPLLTLQPDDLYLKIEVARDDEDYNSLYDQKNGGYGSCTFGYHARSSSPYSTCIWKMEPGEDGFHLVTRLPRRLHTFNGF